MAVPVFEVVDMIRYVVMYKLVEPNTTGPAGSEGQ
jgi:hypothetical protein